MLSTQFDQSPYLAVCHLSVSHLTSSHSTSFCLNWVTAVAVKRLSLPWLRPVWKDTEFCIILSPLQVGSEPYCRSQHWLWKRKHGMLIRIQRPFIDVHSLRNLCLRLRPSIIMMMARKKTSSTFQVQIWNLELLVRFICNDCASTPYVALCIGVWLASAKQ